MFKEFFVKTELYEAALVATVFTLILWAIL